MPGPRLIALTLLTLSHLAITSAAAPAAAESAGDRVAAAARHLIDTLDEGQRQKVQFEFGDEIQRKRWSNLPTGIYQRHGLRLGDLKPAQRDAVFAVLAAALSRGGYEKVRQIIEGDELLRKGQQPAANVVFGRDEYYLSFLGRPSTDAPWTIQFGGHHLALNITLAGDRETLSPSHTAAQPARYEFEGRTIRPLGRETDKAFALVGSLDESQRKQAILGSEMRDLVLGPGHDGETLQPEGIKGSALMPAQRDALVDLVSEWTGIQHPAAARAKLEEVKAGIADTWFAWSGPTASGSAAYFRIQGPAVFIEYAPQKLGGDPTQHIHTMYRDPRNEYGIRWQKR